MGLFDSIANQVIGSLAGGQSDGVARDALAELLAEPSIGGLPGLIQAFQQQGLGTLITSWLGNGDNLPVSAEQLRAVLGSAPVQAVAARLGLPVDDLLAKLADALPGLIDTLSPGGKLPDAAALLGLLKG